MYVHWQLANHQSQCYNHNELPVIQFKHFKYTNSFWYFYKSAKAHKICLLQTMLEIFSRLRRKTWQMSLFINVTSECFHLYFQLHFVAINFEQMNRMSHRGIQDVIHSNACAFKVSYTVCSSEPSVFVVAKKMFTFFDLFSHEYCSYMMSIPCDTITIPKIKEEKEKSKINKMKNRNWIEWQPIECDNARKYNRYLFGQIVTKSSMA